MSSSYVVFFLADIKNSDYDGFGGIKIISWLQQIDMKQKSIRTPVSLIPGDVIAVLAPASPFDKDEFNRGVGILKSMGFEVFLPPGLFASKGYLAGDDSHRADLLNDLFKLPQIKAVMCARGGYGSARILNKIDYESVRKNPKIFVGFSDISALLTTFYEKCGLVTFHGPTITSLADTDQETIKALFSVLTSQKVLSIIEPKSIVVKPGLAKGPVTGGNLTTLCHLVGTPFEASFSGHILFLEDCKESPYRIDRMLTHMKMAGCFDNLSGMIIGSFFECGKMGDIIKIFEDLFSDFNFPILAGISIGHQKKNMTLPVGLKATLNADEKYLCYHCPSTIPEHDKTIGTIFYDKNTGRRLEGVNFKQKSFDCIHKLMQRAIDNFIFPGAILLFSKNGSILFHRAYGIANVFDNTPVTRDTVFDLASLTKPLATTTSLMALITDQKLGIEDSLSAILPEFGNSEKKDIQIDHLLAHTGGFPDYQPFFKCLEKYPFNERKARLRQMLVNVPLKHAAGEKTLYSDLGFMILEWAVERVADCSLDRYVKDKVFDPLGLNNLFFQDVRRERKMVEYAATEICPWRKTLMEGFVHDENAFVTGGTGGHAGLFGTAKDVYRLLEHLIETFKDPYFKGLFSCELVKKFLCPYKKSHRTLGFDMPSQKDSSAGHLFSPLSAGHLGFTGTSFWIDLQRSMVIVLLTNRIHPDRKNHKLKYFRPILHDAIMRQILETS